MFTNDNSQNKVKKANYTKKEKILLLLEFYNEFGKWPKYNEKYKEVNLGTFLQNIKNLTTKISNEDYDILKEKGAFISYNECKAHQKVLLLLDFYENFGRWPKRNDQYKGVNLGNFLNFVKNNVTKVSNEDYDILKEKGAFISHNEYKKHQKVLLLLEFYENFGRWPKRNEQYKGVNLGNFLNFVKNNVTKISNGDYSALRKKGFLIKL